MTAPAVDRRASRRGGAGGPTGSAGRLPAPVKERRPALAALAVLLIVGGALASGLLVLRSGDRDDYLVVTRVVDPGQKITDDDLGLAQIAGSGANAISAANRSDVVGDYATTRIFPGTLVTEAMTSDDLEIADGMTIVGTVLATNQRPAATLNPGDLVTVLAVPRTDATGTQQSVVLLDSAEVVDVEETSTNGSLAVSLLVPLGQVPEVTAAAAQGTVAVARLPGLAVPAVADAPASGPGGNDPTSNRPSNGLSDQPRNAPSGPAVPPTAVAPSGQPTPLGQPTPFVQPTQFGQPPTQGLSTSGAGSGSGSVGTP